MRLALLLVAALICLPQAFAQKTTVVASGDFDGDGKADTVEIARIGDILENLVPGSTNTRHVARDRAELDKIGDQTAIVVRRAADTRRLYLLMSSTHAAVAACDIRVNPPGEYAAGGANGREVLVAKNNVIAISCLAPEGPGTLLKYWSEANGGEFPGAWLPN